MDKKLHKLAPNTSLVGSFITQLSTPLPVIDEDRLENNITRVQSYMDKIGKAFRPHIKTHKIPAIATRQAEAGAQGLNCQKISEADVFADAGFQDILITFSILGPEKLEELAVLNGRIDDLKVVADSATTVSGLSGMFGGKDKALKVLVECDTGGGRCGVQSAAEAFDLACLISGSDGLTFGGLLTYPKTDGELETEAFLSEAIGLLKARGITCGIVSNGGTPSLFNAHLVPSATEHRAGTYVYNDRAMARAGHCSLDDCAMEILATVVSRPTQTRAVIDAGSKALTSDLLGFDDFGYVVNHPEAVITGLSEEHGVLDLSKCDPDKRPQVGDRIRIIPNHTCVVSNLVDQMVFHKGGVITRVEPVAARGYVW
ncbi:D-TA family PLP-dependent enzyme [Roseibium algae]|uniref:D-TA family PLP-dependent enzyme n=1 Tax=Roseibium algae TaxID=3123038 RepID=A0ABU8THW0_9HYPH